MKVSAAVRKLNPDIFPGSLTDLEKPPAVVIGHAAFVPVRGGKGFNNIPEILAEKSTAKRLRQDTKPLMNKLEERFYETKLRPDYIDKGQRVLIQAVRLELARGLWYKPDFFLPAVMPSGKDESRFRPAIAYEVKGPKVFRGGFENLKAAARVHPWIKFFLVWEDEDDGHWERQEILS